MKLTFACLIGFAPWFGYASLQAAPTTPTNPPSLYWFVPDGMRADPDLFNIYKWADEGKLPNIRRLMDRGAYGFAKPAFPSHTPANFACLFTGAYPEVHGVNDGPMRAEGNPLSQVAVAGFSSAAKKVEPFWVTLEKALDCNITLLSIPGSTPPELKKGVTIRGRWGRWGADFHALNFQDVADPLLKKVDPNAARLFYMGAPLSQNVQKRAASAEWSGLPKAYSPVLEADLAAWGATIHAAICDTTDNNTVDYDTVAFSPDRRNILASCQRGSWSDWIPIVLKWQLPQQNLARDVPSSVKIKVIKLDPSGAFRIRALYNNLNRFQTDPDYVSDELVRGVGPMVDFVDNFPPQLIFCPEDKETFLEEADFSLTWHYDAIPFIVKQYKPRIFIQDTYTPNQLLTSRWWMGYIDPESSRYNEVSPAQREQLWKEVFWLYKKLDDIIGQMLDNAQPNTYIVLSSDHGAIPLNRQVRLNNLFAREGLLKFNTDEKTGARVIDWAQTKAVYIQMQNIFMNPAGLAGNWHRASGKEYEQLRKKVRQLLLDMKDENGVHPVEKVATWEQASKEFRLMSERAGDLIVANRPGFGWTEQMSEDHQVFAVPLVTGYKQALVPEKNKGVWTPFIVSGPGIKPGYYLGSKPVNIIDEHPTLLHALGVKTPPWVQGKLLKNIFQKP